MEVGDGVYVAVGVFVGFGVFVVAGPDDSLVFRIVRSLFCTVGVRVCIAVAVRIAVGVDVADGRS